MPSFGRLLMSAPLTPGLDEPALDALNERLLHALSDSGRIHLTQTRGRCVIRFAIGQRTTEPRHVQAASRSAGKLTEDV